CYRPFSVQERFWTLVADERYVGKPRRDSQGDPLEGSRHNRGAAVDVSLVNLASGEELAMPTDYDDFSERAAADYGDLSAEVIANRKILTDAMAAHGFTVLPSEWWHFDAEGWEEYPLLDIELR
ncbi:MAG: M15 family metallopeptidase, partial [Bacteroidales bacterium]|nr:M15 family metallopeptidase [Bacteroidales bacterium]